MLTASSLHTSLILAHFVFASCTGNASCTFVLVQTSVRQKTKQVQGFANDTTALTVETSEDMLASKPALVDDSGLVNEPQPLPVASLASTEHVEWTIYDQHTYDCEAVLQFSKQKSFGIIRTYETGVNDYAIMVPTYPGDVAQYDILVASYRAYFSKQNVDFVTVFSSNQDCREVLRQCDTCGKTRIEIMVFDYLYDTTKESWAYKDKFNYQAAKKIWALDNMKQEHVLVVDSDFSFRPTKTHVSLVEMASLYENVMFATAPNSRPDEGWLDREVLKTANRLLGTKFDFLPLDPPWFYQKKHVGELRKFLQAKWGTDDYVHGIMNGPQVFEIVLYRFFLMKRAETGAAHVETIDVGGGGYLFDQVFSEAERLSIHPPPVALRCCHVSRDPCKICWLQVHNDRDGCIDHVNGTTCG